MHRVKLLVLAASVAAMVGCSDSPGNPLEPGSTSDGASSSNAAADGSTLKASVPVLLSPKDDVRVDTRRPTLTFENSRGQYQSAAYTYRLELYEVNNLISTVLLQQGGGGQTSHTVPSDLNYNTTYRWRVRAELDGTSTAYAATVDFLSPEPPPPPAAAPIPTAPTTGGGGGGTVGGNRSIGLSEAFNMIVSYHNSSGTNLGSSSSRESRVAFLWAAVAIIHYGHPRYNPAGGDPGWCVKDAGGGRPPSDDVLVQCSSREAWDLIGGAGANGYSFHLDGLGRLGGEQNVYPPPRSSLP